MTTTHDTRTSAPRAPRRRRAAATALVLGALAFAPTAGATAAPIGLQVSSLSDGSLVLPGAHAVAGTVTWGVGPAGTVTVTNGANGDTCTFPLSDGTFSCLVDIVLGPNVIDVTAQDDGDSAIDTVQLTVRGISAPLVFTSPDTSGGPVAFMHSDTLPFAGTGPIEPGLTVSILWKVAGADDSTYDPLCATNIATDGSWACPIYAPSVGDLTFRARTVDTQGTVITDEVDLEILPVSVPEASYTFGPASVEVAATTDSTDPWLDLSLYGVGPNYPVSYDWVGPLDNCQDEVAALACTFTGITPGVWRIHVDAYYRDRNDFVRIPSAPTLTTTVGADRRVTFTVTKQPDAEVDIRESGSGTVLCTIGGTGTSGSCTASVPAGERTFTAQSRSVGFVAATASDGFELVVPDASLQGLSALTVGETVVIPAARVARTTAPQAEPWEWRYVFEGGDALLPGDVVGVRGDGPPPGTVVTLELHSTPVVLGSMIVGDDRTFRITGIVPLDTEPGDHELVLRAEVAGETPREQREPIGVRAVEAEPVAEAPVETTGTAAGGGAADGSSRNDPGAPNALSDSLPTLRFLWENPAALAAAAVLALALLFLVSIPTELLNSALASGSGNRGRVLRTLAALGERSSAALHRVLRSRIAVSAVVVVALSLVYCFADPGFGFDLASLRMLLALAIALFVLTWGVGALTGAIARRAWGAQASIAVDLSIVPLAVIAVIVSRLVDFSPGFFIGLAIGVELVVASRRARVGASLVGFGVVIGVSVLAWLGYSAMADAPLDDFGGALVNDTLVAIAVEGLTAAAVAALPLTFLEGRAIWEVSKRLWLAVFLVVQFVFCVIVLPTAMSLDEVADLGVWALVLGGYCLITLATWQWLVRRDRAGETAGESAPAADDETRRNTSGTPVP